MEALKLIGKIFTVIGFIGLAIFLGYFVYTAVSHDLKMKRIVKKHYKDRDNGYK